MCVPSSIRLMPSSAPGAAMKILCLHPASSGVSLGRGKKPANYSNVIKPVTIRDERAVMGTVCPHTPAHLISIGKARASVGDLPGRQTWLRSFQDPSDLLPGSGAAFKAPLLCFTCSFFARPLCFLLRGSVYENKRMRLEFHRKRSSL